MKKQKWKIEKINVATILCLFLVACPILDVVSFLFRNQFQTSFSPSTLLRPVIPITVTIYLFFKKDKKFKLYTLISLLLYGIYAIIHLCMFEQAKTESSYSNLVHEAQYLVNYSFMILNFFLYYYVFKDSETDRFKKSIFYTIICYMFLLIISLASGTSSHTYMEEQIGYKGWFESGNSLSAILVLSLFILLPLIKIKVYQKIVIPTLIVLGIFLTTIVGTRVGLLGYLFVCILYFIVESLHYLMHDKKINKKYIFAGIGCITLVIVIIGTLGSATIQRRKQLKDQENKIIDPMTNQVAHLTGDLIYIKQQIDENTLSEGFMGDAEKKSIVELYNIANKLDLSHTQMRTIQVIYNALLVKNQANPCYILFGNGYLANFRELVLEMEIPAFLFNFGIFGFCLYFVPFLAIFVYGTYVGLKYRKKISTEYIMLLLGSGFTFALSFFSGYTFFNSSTMMIIIAINVLMMEKIRKIKKEEKQNEKNIIWDY